MANKQGRVSQPRRDITRHHSPRNAHRFLAGDTTPEGVKVGWAVRRQAVWVCAAATGKYGNTSPHE